jgi:hypothetical protein
MTDLDAIQSRLDRGVESLTDTHDLLREVELLRGEAGRERAAVVAFVRGARLDDFADAIERGEHRLKENE